MSKSRFYNGIVLVTDDKVHGVAMPARCTPCEPGYPKLCSEVNPNPGTCRGFVHAEKRYDMELGAGTVKYLTRRCDQCDFETETEQP